MRGDLAQRNVEGEIKQGHGFVITQHHKMTVLTVQLMDQLVLRLKLVIKVLAKVCNIENQLYLNLIHFTHVDKLGVKSHF